MGLRIGAQFPAFSLSTAAWLNNPQRTLSGYPLLIHFWAISCPLCKMNMKQLYNLRDHYAQYGLQFTAVHMPRCDDDKNEKRIVQSITQFAMTEPCLIDHDHSVGNAFETGGVWPIYFLFDSEGKLRCRAAGGLGVRMMERTLIRLFPNAPELEAAACPCGKNGAGGCCQDS